METHDQFPLLVLQPPELIFGFYSLAIDFIVLRVVVDGVGLCYHHALLFVVEFRDGREKLCCNYVIRIG